MKGINTVIIKRFGISFLFTIAFVWITSVQTYGQNTPFTLHAVSDLKRVFEDGYNLPELTDSIKIFGIGGEVLSGQCVVFSTANLSDVTVKISPIRNKESGVTLPSNSVEWNFVGSIPLSTNAPNQPEYEVVRKAPARYPDYLKAERQINLSKGTYQSIWLTISIPRNVVSGSYTGTVTIASTQSDKSIPVLIQIYPLTMPEKRNLKIAEWYTTKEFERLHGIHEKYSEDWFAMLRKYAENMVEHRQNVFQVPASAIENRKSSTGEFQFDFTLFDQIAEVFWETGHMDFLETGELFRFGEGGWSGREINPKDFNVIDEKTGSELLLPGYEILPHLLPALEDHLRQKRWLNKTIFHVKDEPSLHNAMAWQKASRYIHEHAPDLKRVDAIETPYILGDIEIAIPKLDGLASWYDDYKKSTEHGVELWFYTVGIFQSSLLPNKTIDMPLVDNRIMHWLNYKYDASGFLHWGWNHWTEDPYHETGKHLGDGWHVYPTKEGVLNSLRWEQMRNGIQDYEYFLMLEKKISLLRDSLGARFSWINPKQRSKEIISQVVKNFVEQTDNPNVVYTAKKEVIKQILEFDTSPRVYIQTNPVAGSTMTAQSSVEVYGWTVPGTTIVVNGETLPVSEQGLFLEKFLMSPAYPDIKVLVSSDKGSKEFIRKFMVH